MKVVRYQANGDKSTITNDNATLEQCIELVDVICATNYDLRPDTYKVKRGISILGEKLVQVFKIADLKSPYKTFLITK